MIKVISRFILSITILLAVILGIHLFILDLLLLPLFENKIFDSYLINAVLTIVIFASLLVLKDKFAESLGYLFFIGSFFKFIAFFILIYPFFKEDGDVSRLEFSSFFIPYAASLIFEVTFLIKILNKES